MFRCRHIPQTQGFALPGSTGHRPGDERANFAVQDPGGLLPIEWRFLFAQFLGIAGVGIVLRTRRHFATRQTIQGRDKRLGAEPRQTIMQRLRRVMLVNGNLCFRQHWAGVEAAFHLHDGYSRHGITRLNRTRDRCCAAPAWQQ